MAIYNVNVAFNVEASSQSEAAQKTASYLRQHFSTGFYEAIEEPELQQGIDADDCETLIT
jgi:hypothetical protein